MSPFLFHDLHSIYPTVCQRTLYPYGKSPSHRWQAPSLALALLPSSAASVSTSSCSFASRAGIARSSTVGHPSLVLSGLAPVPCKKIAYPIKNGRPFVCTSQLYLFGQRLMVSAFRAFFGHLSRPCQSCPDQRTNPPADLERRLCILVFLRLRFPFVPECRRERIRMRPGCDFYILIRCTRPNTLLSSNHETHMRQVRDDRIVHI